MQAEGLGEAQRVKNAISDIERKAREMATGPAGSWGVNFQRNLERLKTTPGELDEIRRSWVRLNDSFKERGIDKALRSTEISTWKNATISHFAAVRSAHANQMAAIEQRQKLFANNISTTMKPVLVMLGGYTGFYLAGTMGREGLIAASNARRVEAEAKFSGLSEDERARISGRADELAPRYRLERSDIQEVLKEAALSMPDTATALAVSDSMARFFILRAAQTDAVDAIAGLRAFNKAMDNIEKVTPEEYEFFLGQFAKAQQVAGADISPDAYAQAIKYARAGGKVYGDDFLASWLPFIIAETGGSDAGTQLRAAFDQFIVGRASKQALNRQRDLGIRGEDGQLIGGDAAFTHNPVKWVNEHLIPQLARSGVDLEDETAVAKIVGEITNNRLSSDLLSRIVLSYEQYRRLAEDRLPNAMGLDAADEVQDLNPFAAWDGFKSSLQNLSAALLPMEQITAGLNNLADGINGVAVAAKESPGQTALTIGAAGWAAYAGGKWAAGKLMDPFGLRTSAVALDGSAAALTRAAIALGGSGAVGGPTGGGKSPAGTGINPFAIIPQAWLYLTGREYINSWLGASDTPGMLENIQNLARRIPASSSATEVVGGANAYRWDGPMGADGGPRAPIRPEIDDAVLIVEAQTAASDLERALSVDAKPNVDTSSIDIAIGKARELMNLLRQAGTAAEAAKSNVGGEMRRNFSDSFGAMP